MPNRPSDASHAPIESSSRAPLRVTSPPILIGTFAGTARQSRVTEPLLTAPPLSSLDHARGDPEATRVLIEYGDYQCPFCAAAEPVVVEVLRRHDRGLMQAFRHFPLEAIHPMASPAAETAEFAASQGDFWSMHGALMANSASLSLPLIFNLAALLGHSTRLLRDALISGAEAAKVRRDFAMGLHSGVQGTPTFFIDGALYVGPITADALTDALNRPAGAMSASPKMAIRR